MASWQEDVESLLARLPREFSLSDIYRFVPWLYARHPDNFNVEAKIRQVLQILRDAQRVEFLNGGRYRQTHATSPIEASLGFVIGHELTRLELSKRLGQTGDAPLRRGMFKPASGPFRNHMFLFHNETENPYGDVHEGNVIRYVGQGLTGNQELKGFNATLAQHLESGIQVHYFVQPRDAPGKIRYRGQVFVDSFQEVQRPEEGRSVWEFTLLPVAADSDPGIDYGTALREMLDYSRGPGPIERPRVEKMTQVRLRDKAFGRLVIPAYQRKCAVCRDPLRKSDLLTELEAAHILPVADGGPDELRNGLSLCGRHHWSFDNGLFTISDGLQVEWLSPEHDPHREIRDGMDLYVPVKDPHKPHPEYLRWHRRQWGTISGAGAG